MSDIAPTDEAVRIAADYLTAHDIAPQDASPQLALNALAEWSRKNPTTQVGRWMLEVYEMARPKVLDKSLTANEVGNLKAGKSVHALDETSRDNIWQAVKARFDLFRAAWAEFQETLPRSDSSW